MSATLQVSALGHLPVVLFQNEKKINVVICQTAAEAEAEADRLRQLDHITVIGVEYGQVK